MISITRKTDYALVALATLAQFEKDGSGPVSVRQIAEAFGFPLPQMMNVLKELHHAGFVGSERGTRGGYYLAEAPAEIRLLQVIEAFEGPVRLMMCCEDEEHGDAACVACQVIDQCPITVSMRKVNDRVVEFLRSITLQDLIDSEVNVTVPQVAIAVSARPGRFLKGAGDDRD